MIESGFLAELSDLETIVMRKHFIPKNGICDLRRAQEIHLKQTSLLCGLVRSVVLEGIEEEGSCLLNHILRNKDIDDAIDINEAASFFIRELIGEFSALFGIQSHNVLEKTGVIGRVARLLGVRDDLVELTGLGETCDDLVRDVGTQVDGQGEVEVMRTDGIAEFFRALQFVLLEPFFEEILAILSEDGTSEFEGLVTVQGAFVEENAKVLKNGRELARLHGYMLESFNCIGCSKDSLLIRDCCSKEDTLGEFAATLAASL